VVAVAVEFAKSLTDPWQAITCQVFGAGWSRGASNDRGVLTIAEAGQATVYLVDPRRDLDPKNPASVFAGQIDVGVPFRISLAGNVAFTGRIEAIHHDLNPDKGNIPMAQIDAVDPIAKLAGVQADWPALPAESSDARIVRILDAAQVTLRDVQAGGLSLQASAAGESDAWSLIVDVVQNELGSVELRPDGTLVFRTRRTTWTAAAPLLHIGCGAGALPLTQLGIDQQRSTIRNRVAAKIAGSGTTNVYFSQPSVDRYGLKTLSKTDLVLTSDSAAMLWASFVGRRTANPTQAYQGVEVPNATTVQVAAIEGVPLFTGRVHVTVDGWGNPIDLTLRLLGVSWDVNEVAQATAALVLGTDWPLLPVGRDFVMDSDAQWALGMGAGSGVFNWEISGGTLRVEDTPDAFGGIASFVLTWNAQG
jgi:hypothetical protein